MKTSILFLVFNRPKTTKIVFETIRQAKPPRLYIAADGPRENRPDDVELCKEVKEIVSDIDWNCEVITLYRSQNLGCKKAVSTAITWFFENEAEGIIIEDDILPLPCFFEYCDKLLEKYRNEERVAMITGNNLISKRFYLDESYFFSHYSNIWGWATWRRVWKQYDAEMKTWPSWSKSGKLKKLSDNIPYFEFFWKDQLQEVYDGKINTWDYQFFLLLWQIEALCIVPKNNLIDNLGFGATATHTTGEIPAYLKESETEQLYFPLKHPADIKRQLIADKMYGQIVFNISFLIPLKKKIGRIPFLGNGLHKIKKMFKF